MVWCHVLPWTPIPWSTLRSGSHPLGPSTGSKEFSSTKRWSAGAWRLWRSSCVKMTYANHQPAKSRNAGIKGSQFWMIVVLHLTPPWQSVFREFFATSMWWLYDCTLLFQDIVGTILGSRVRKEEAHLKWPCWIRFASTPALKTACTRARKPFTCDEAKPERWPQPAKRRGSGFSLI